MPQNPVGQATVVNVKKNSEPAFNISTTIPTGDINQLGLKLKVEKVMVAREAGN